MAMMIKTKRKRRNTSTTTNKARVILAIEVTRRQDMVQIAAMTGIENFPMGLMKVMDNVKKLEEEGISNISF